MDGPADGHGADPADGPSAPTATPPTRDAAKKAERRAFVKDNIIVFVTQIFGKLKGIIVLPMLVVLANAFGILGGYLVAVRLLGANPVVYMENSFQFLDLNDLWSGLIKAAAFGLLITLIGCQQGFDTRGGAEGVGRSTTAAVVLGSLAILVSDFFLTKVLF